MTRLFGRQYYQASAWLSAAIAALILVVLCITAAPGLVAAKSTLLTTTWQPSAGIYGIIPMLYGSFLVMIIAMTIALPLGIFAAFALYNMPVGAARRILRGGVEILAGIPSIVYGLIGVAYISVWIADGFGLQTGRLILTAGLILSVMVLPTIIALSTDALSSVPKHYRENAEALGLYRYEVLKDAILPQAKAGIIAASLLALGRALGETMAVMLVIGSLDRLPEPLLNVLSSGQTITAKLGRELGESAFGSTHFSVLVLMSLILVTFTLALTLLASKITAKTAEHHA